MTKGYFILSFGRLIEKASQQDKRQCSEIFLDEWGISGRRRPTVQLLRQYLEKANLKRAMTHVAEKLLGGLIYTIYLHILHQSVEIGLLDYTLREVRNF